MKLKELKNKEPENWFTKKPIEHPCESQVWIRSGYDRSEKKYWCYRWSNINDGMYISGDKEVYTDFIF